MVLSTMRRHRVTVRCQREMNRFELTLLRLRITLALTQNHAMLSHLLAKRGERVGDLLERLYFLRGRATRPIGVIRIAAVRVQELHELVQVRALLRQLAQRGIVVIPKSVHKERVRQNLDLFDFELTEDEMERLRTLDEDRSMWAEYDDPMIVRYAMAVE